MLPNANGAAVTVLRADVGRPRAGHDQFHAPAPPTCSPPARRRKLDTIVTARAFVEKGRLGGLIAAIDRHVNIVYLEDIRTTRRPSPTSSAACCAGEGRWWRASPTTGRRSCSPRARKACPKGVVLSHRNMLANAAQAAARIDFGREDKLFNVLPVFHSFGFTVGVVLPLVSRRAASISIPRRCTTARCRS